jgi:hypothetical protein
MARIRWERLLAIVLALIVVAWGFAMVTAVRVLMATTDPVVAVRSGTIVIVLFLIASRHGGHDA